MKTAEIKRTENAARERARYRRMADAGMARHQLAPESLREANRKAREKKLSPERLAAKRAREADPEAHKAAMMSRRKEAERLRNQKRQQDPEKRARMLEMKRLRNATPEAKAKAAANNRAYRTRAGEALAKKKAEWKASNPDAVVAYHAARRARKLNATPSWFGELDELVMLEAADLCRRRETATGFPWQVDHMVPLQARNACGLHVAANLQVIPASMNGAKLNRMRFTLPGEWIGAL